MAIYTNDDWFRDWRVPNRRAQFGTMYFAQMDEDAGDLAKAARRRRTVLRECYTSADRDDFLKDAWVKVVARREFFSLYGEAVDVNHSHRPTCETVTL